MTKQQNNGHIECCWKGAHDEPAELSYVSSVMIDLDRLAEMRRIPGKHDRSALGALRQEIMGEIAASLGRAEERIVASLARLAQLGTQLDEVDESPPNGAGVSTAALSSRRALLADYEAERGRLRHLRWELMVQREALGLKQHDALERLYPVPPRRPG